jgi:hypothetical protein
MTGIGLLVDLSDDSKGTVCCTEKANGNDEGILLDSLEAHKRLSNFKGNGGKPKNKPADETQRFCSV